MSPLEWSLWCDLIAKRSGMFFAENRKHIVERCLQSRMVIRQIRSVVEYYHAVAHEAQGQQEWEQLLELLLNKETSFFRHPATVAVLVHRLIPALQQRVLSREDRVVRIWSACCSTGQEVYSLAMSLFAVPGEEDGIVQITGSDISRDALEQARRGCYKPFQTKGIPEPFRQRFLRRVKENGETAECIADEVRNRVCFAWFDLNEPTSYPETRQDVVCCQNTLMYFQHEKRTKILHYLCNHIRPGGYLLVGPTDAVGIEMFEMTSSVQAGVLVYQRKM